MNQKIAIITGASAGIGLELTKFLLANNIKVVMACRSNPSDRRKEFKLNSKNLYFIKLDLSDLESIKLFVNQFESKFSKLDLLINNAGVMNPPFSLTKQGFESQFSVNYLGHFMLTKLLLNSLGKVEKSKIVNVSSLAAEKATIDFDSFRNDKNYDKAYGQSKLALLLFTFKLNEYLKDQKHSSLVFSAHPGFAKTNLHMNVNSLIRKIHVKYLQYRYAQSAEKGISPILKAISDSDLKGGEYFGPNGKGGLKGDPVQIKYPKAALDESIATKLWHYSEEQLNTFLS